MKLDLSKVAIGLLTVTSLWSCQKNFDKGNAPFSANEKQVSSPKILKDFVQVNLVGDNNEYNPLVIDPNLINGWGIAFPTSGPAWVSAFGTGKSTLYNPNGTSPRAPVNIPSPASNTDGHPTGIVFNSTTDFKLPNGNPARFIFAQVEGMLSGWNTGNDAIKKTNPDGGEYLGLAIGSSNGSNYLYVADFGTGRIRVYDKNWQEVQMPFTDPNLPAEYTPLNIQNIDGGLYVMYGLHGVGEPINPRNGFVDVFNTDGTFRKRFISHGQLNAPWGIAKAPAGFWGDDLLDENIFLVGNFGDGHINAYNADGVFQGQLRAHGNPIVIEKLWGITFAPATSTVFNHNQLYFVAGPDNEEHGLFGYIAK